MSPLRSRCLTVCLAKIHCPVHVEKGNVWRPLGVNLKQRSTCAFFHLFAFSFSWETLACPSFTWTSTGRSKNLTMTGSLSRDARTCSNENDHSVSERPGPASWLLWEPEVSELSGVVEASSVADSSTAALLAGFLDSDGLLGSWSLRPTSSILRRRLVTWATAR